MHPPVNASAGLTLWLDAADPYTFTYEKGRITTWHDDSQSGSGLDFVRSRRSPGPKYDLDVATRDGGINGLPAVHFEATSTAPGKVDPNVRQQLVTATPTALLSTAGMTLFVVKKDAGFQTHYIAPSYFKLEGGASSWGGAGPKARGGWAALRSKVTPGFDELMAYTTGFKAGGIRAKATSYPSVRFKGVGGSAVHVMTYSVTTDGIRMVRDDGSHARVSTLDGQMIVNGAGHLVLGAGLVGHVGEVLAYNRTLTAAEEEETRLYLERKWRVGDALQALDVQAAMPGARPALAAWSLGGSVRASRCNSTALALGAWDRGAQGVSGCDGTVMGAENPLSGVDTRLLCLTGECSGGRYVPGPFGGRALHRMAQPVEGGASFALAGRQLESFTVAFWYRLLDEKCFMPHSPSQCAQLLSTNDKPWGPMIQFGGEKHGGRQIGILGVASDVALDLGAWHHVGLTVEAGATATLYVDGKVAMTKTSALSRDEWVLGERIWFANYADHGKRERERSEPAA